MVGMLVEGAWRQDAEDFMREGAFDRAPSGLDAPLAPDVVKKISAGTGRYRLVASMSCPWSHRVLLVRAIKGLGALLPLTLAGEPRVQGYGLGNGADALAAGASAFEHVHQLYTATDPRYSGRATVPVLWDRLEQRIVSNDSGQIMRALDRIDEPQGFTLMPPPVTDVIEALNRRIYDGLANAVYRAGLAQSQNAYEAAVHDVFATLSDLEARLGRSRYLFGRVVTEADLRLFATLVRFDLVYATHFRCTRRRLVDHANLWGYARDLFGWRGVAATVDPDAIREGYYRNDGVHNPWSIIAEAPEMDWHRPHRRARFGAAQIWTRRDEATDIDPATLGEEAG